MLPRPGEQGCGMNRWSSLDMVPTPVRRFINSSFDLGIRVANAVIRQLHPPVLQASDPDIVAIRAKAAIGTDISSHLEPMFFEALRQSPRVIVELGVRGGESTWVLESVARRCGAVLIGVDVDDCSTVCQSENWYFVQEDDVAFGQRFATWCREHGVADKIDVLFIDTSHLYSHTVAEIEAWFPHLSEAAVVMFHDTNIKRLYRRRDWTLGRAWDNRRGVIRALEEILHEQLDERHRFEREVGRWHVTHDPICNGFTVLKRKVRPETGMPRNS